MNLVIAGYYGFDNAGDELLLESILTACRHPSRRVTVLSHRPGATSRQHGVTTVSRWNPVAILAALRRSDRLVFGGGGLFQDITSRRSLGYYLALVHAARLLRKPVSLCGVGVDPISDSRLRRSLGRALDREATVISVRDNTSAEALSACGVPSDRIALAADLAFALPLERVVSPAKTGQGLLVVVRNGAGNRDLWEWLLAGARFREWAPSIGSFQPGPDAALADTLAAEFDGAKAAGVLDFRAAPQAVAAAERVISARFHALVLAALAGRPFLGIGRGGKVEAVCRAFGMPYLDRGCDEGEALEALDRLEKAPSPDARTVDRLRASARGALDHVTAEARL